MKKILPSLIVFSMMFILTLQLVSAEIVDEEQTFPTKMENMETVTSATYTETSTKDYIVRFHLARGYGTV
jgi:hypothetical protein